jgi:hypothetical protein
MEVKCIDASGAGAYLTQGKIYTVQQEFKTQYTIYDNSNFLSTYDADRFEVVSSFQNFKVRCIDNAGELCTLILGRIYEVEGESVSGDDYKLVGWGLSWNKRRFEKVDDNSITGPIPLVNDRICPTCKNDRCSRTEKACWKCGNSLTI